MKNQNLELILTFLGIQFINYKGKRTSNGHVTAKTIGEIKKFFGKEVMTSGQFIDEIKWWDFENDWNDLMFLIQKIESLSVDPKVIHWCRQTDKNIFDLKLSEVNIQKAYNACVKFIEWYNEQNK